MQSGDLDFKIQEVEAAFKRQVATELQETRDRLNELEVTLRRRSEFETSSSNTPAARRLRAASI